MCKFRDNSVLGISRSPQDPDLKQSSRMQRAKNSLEKVCCGHFQVIFDGFQIWISKDHQTFFEENAVELSESQCTRESRLKGQFEVTVQGDILSPLNSACLRSVNRTARSAVRCRRREAPSAAAARSVVR